MKRFALHLWWSLFPSVMIRFSMHMWFQFYSLPDRRRFLSHHWSRLSDDERQFLARKGFIL